jgi:general secretion pathway protein E
MAIAGDGPVTIGRDPKNSLVIKDDRLSRFHCVIERDGEAFRVRDLKSRNGTTLNDRRVEEARLNSGDWLKLGRIRIHFTMESPRGGKAPARRPRTPKAADSDTLPAAAPDDADRIDWELLEPHGKAGHAMPVATRPTAIDDMPALRSAVEKLTGRPSDDSAISLINARGQTVHEALLKDAGEEAAAGSENALRCLLLLCLRMRGTDLHVEPSEGPFQVRVRIDGMMTAALQLTSRLGQRLVRVVKILGDIDIAQSQSVQEGHFSAALGERRVDYRVSLTPAVHGQKLVLRVLDLANTPQFLRQLHLPVTMHGTLRDAVGRDSGMVLLCGPTGSGKTTTLYALLREIDATVRNVITIEDPIEYQIEGLTQLPVSEAQGNSFAALLRSVLRQDPDVLLVGEVRDPQTASTALQAAMTGHMVLSTVHARDTIGAALRLLNLGVEPYMAATGLSVVVAQRLMRQLCPHCKREAAPTSAQADRFAKHDIPAPAKLFEAVGCSRCWQTGHFGRRGAFEMLSVNDELRDAMLCPSAAQELRRVVQAGDFVSLAVSSLRMAGDGITSMVEAERVAGS